MLLLALAACSNSASSTNDAVGSDAAGPPHLTTRAGGTPANAMAVAFQNGDGPWTLANGVGGSYPIETTTGRYAFAIACGSTGKHVLLRATLAERPDPVIDCDVNPGSPNVDGSLSGASAGTIELALGYNVTQASGTSSYSLSAPAGTYDLLAADLSGGRLVVKRAVTIPATVNLDLTSQGVPLTAGSHTIDVSGSGSSYVVVRLATAKTPAPYATEAELTTFGVVIGTGQAPLHYPEPASDPGDLYSALVSDIQTGAGPLVLATARSDEQFFAATTDVALALPAPYTTPTLSRLSGPPTVIMADLPTYSDAVDYTVECNQGFPEWNVDITAGALVAGIGVPDLALVQAFPAQFPAYPDPASPILCIAAAISGDDLGHAPTAGTVHKRAAVEISVP